MSKKSLKKQNVENRDNKAKNTRADRNLDKGFSDNKKI